MITADAGKRWVLVHNEPGERVRRYGVHGGWLYQVEQRELVGFEDAKGGRFYKVEWSAPAFVPFVAEED